VRAMAVSSVKLSTTAGQFHEKYRHNRRMVSTGTRFYLAVAFIGMLATACGGEDGGGADAANSSSPSSRAPSAAATTSAPSSAPPAALPDNCADETFTVPLAPLIKGKQRGSSSAKADQLLCSWGKGVPGVTMTVTRPSAANTASDFPVVDIPALKQFGAEARAKVTQIALGSRKLYISTFVVTSDRYRISVAYTAEERKDQGVGDAAVGITQRLHT